jgi:NADPH-dependent 2,4-dienoyl-CoA reductase/sulfur reductase-like enzyme/nitrite reductase/ring-hydroxylating ferredoxin subunit
MSGEQQLLGPDLGAGIASTELVDGTPLVGHAHGEAVLLVRRGDEIFAIAAHCSHYGGPLGEGLIDGETVRCPWHHACFSLRSGAAVRPPALKPVACYEVTEEKGQVRVGAARPPVKAPHRSGGPESIVIVGGGAAGSSAALHARRMGYEGAVTIVSTDPEPPYDRPNLSKDYLAGNAPEEWIPLHGPELYEELHIELRTGRTVTAIDPATKTVSLDDGSSLAYGALLLATGAEPRRLPIPGGELPHVRTLRSLADSRALIAAAAEAKHVVVVGASFIGLEVAAALRARNLEVTVVAPEGRPLETVLGPEVGDFLRTLHEEHGVRFRLGERPAEITSDTMRLSSGALLPADLVVIGVGVAPRLGLAEAAGLKVDRGVVVDTYLETSERGIYAAGDIARWPDPHSGESIRVEHWVVAERQGQVAVENILGERQHFDAAPFFWSQHYDLSLNYVGHASQWDQATLTGSLADHSAMVAFRKEGKVRAVATLFRDRESLLAERAIEQQDDEELERVVSS